MALLVLASLVVVYTGCKAGDGMTSGMQFTPQQQVAENTGDFAMSSSAPATDAPQTPATPDGSQQFVVWWLVNHSKQIVYPLTTDQGDCWAATAPAIPVPPGVTGGPITVQYVYSKPSCAGKYDYDYIVLWGINRQPTSGCTATIALSGTVSDPYVMTAKADSPLRCDLTVFVNPGGLEIQQVVVTDAPASL